MGAAEPRRPSSSRVVDASRGRSRRARRIQGFSRARPRRRCARARGRAPRPSGLAWALGRPRTHPMMAAQASERRRDSGSRSATHSPPPLALPSDLAGSGARTTCVLLVAHHVRQDLDGLNGLGCVTGLVVPRLLRPVSDFRQWSEADCVARLAFHAAVESRGDFVDTARHWYTRQRQLVSRWMA